ncbi:major facilitator superfamily domain-containing protein 9-like [Sitophilus oryzae]|uniref:Major facilitator superfamily domain-containing protein 9-like n=1 Tax=Sitophilus oryzae TaxID=7048 RepID=A0A6J2Y370_SITOR|nr:major facilitator superfamily domain-containing protein 9-like [Sitophilus oryzae]
MKVLYVLFALDILNISIPIPIFGVFIRSLGGTPSTLGIINSCCALVGLLLNPIVGSLSDQIGRRGLFIKCLTANLVGNVLLTFFSNSLPLVFVSRLIAAFGSPCNILLRTIVTDIYKTTEEKKAFFDKAAPVLSISFLGGTLLSGFLSELNNGFLKVFMLLVVANSLSVYIASTILPIDDKPQKPTENTSITTKALKELKSAAVNIKTISWPRYWDIFLIKGCYDFSMTIILSNLGLILLNEFGIQGRKMGYVFLFTGVSGVASNILKMKLKKVFDKIPDYNKVIYAGTVLFITYIGLSSAGSIYTFMFFLVALCMTRSFIETTLTEIITTKTQETDKGKVIAAFENLSPLAFFVVPATSGFVAEIFGQRILVASAAIPISVAILLANSRKNKTD